MKAIIGIGIPGSGKTTLLKPLAHQDGLMYINRDDIRAELTGDSSNHSQEKRVTEVMFERMKQGLNRRGIILDATNSKFTDRARIIQFCRQHGATAIVAYYVNVPLEVARLRNTGRDRKVPDEILALMYNRLLTNPPALSEGFDTIETISNT